MTKLSKGENNEKKLILSSLSIVSVLALSGCFSSANLVAPNNREQTITPEAEKKLNKKANQELQQKLKIYKNYKEVSLKDLEKINPKLANTLKSLIKSAQEEFKARKLPQDILDYAPTFLTKDMNDLRLILIKTKSGKFNGRYFPPNTILLYNVDKFGENEEYDKKAIFLIAHELSHAVFLHPQEEYTERLNYEKGIDDASNLALDVALNEAYVKLKKSNPNAANVLDKVAESLEGELYTNEDILTDNKILDARRNSFAVKAAIAAHQQDKLNKLGVNLEIPQKTRIALKKLIKSGLDVTGAINLLTSAKEFTSANLLAITQHPKEHEFEADKFALKIAKKAGYDVKKKLVVCFHLIVKQDFLTHIHLIKIEEKI